MRELKFVTVMPDDSYFTWQCHLWLESLRQIGHSDKAVVLIFMPKTRPQNMKWQQVIDLYPEAKFNFIRDEHDCTSLLGIYISVLRPYTAWRYWSEHPEMKEKAIFYCDSDILFMKDFNVDKFLEDEVCYLSDTNSYINATYFDSKLKDVKPELVEEYKKVDVLDEAAKIVGINRQVCEKNNMHSGGAQYLIKNIDADFWLKVKNDCISLILYLRGINKQFFESENKGFQSWASDMWAVLWNLWLREQETRIVPELGFSWGCDPIERIDKFTIFHNAGITGPMRDGVIPQFYKGKYHQGQDPTKDPHLDIVLNDERSKKLCTWYYASKLKELSNKYQLNY